MGILVTENEVVLSRMTMPQLLQYSLNGVYTSMKTVNGFQYIFKFKEHVKNLHKYLENVPQPTNGNDIKKEASDSDCISPKEHQHVKDKEDVTTPTDLNIKNIELMDLFRVCSEYILKGVSFFNGLDKNLKKEYFNDNSDYAIIIILNWKPLSRNELYKKSCSVYEKLLVLCYMKSLDVHPKYVAVEIMCGKRENPNVKSTEIHKIREELLKLKNKETNEIILYNENNEITEGLSSNFFCFFNNTLYTADDETVLKGTMRQTIIDICTKENIPLEKTVIKTNDIAHFDFCFVCSTSRNICPIKKLTFISSEKVQVFEKDVNHIVLERLQKALAEEVERYKEEYTKYVTGIIDGVCA